MSEYTLVSTLCSDLKGRETFLVPVEWENGWPIFNHGQKISLQSTGPGLYQLDYPVSWRDDFSGPDLQLGWYRKSMSSHWSAQAY